jgi:hypothetical protein
LYFILELLLGEGEQPKILYHLREPPSDWKCQIVVQILVKNGLGMFLIAVDISRYNRIKKYAPIKIDHSYLKD